MLAKCLLFSLCILLTEPRLERVPPIELKIMRPLVREIVSEALSEEHDHLIIRRRMANESLVKMWTSPFLLIPWMILFALSFLSMERMLGLI